TLEGNGFEIVGVSPAFRGDSVFRVIVPQALAETAMTPSVDPRVTALIATPDSLEHVAAVRAGLERLVARRGPVGGGPGVGGGPAGARWRGAGAGAEPPSSSRAGGAGRPDLQAPDGHDHRRVAAGRRDRDHELAARGGGGADPRDRDPEGGRSPAHRHPDPVP